MRYDIESQIPGTGKLRFIEVKTGTPTARPSRSRRTILTALNKPEFWLAIVHVDGDRVEVPRCVRPFTENPTSA